jgi:hypothetical protein
MGALFCAAWGCGALRWVSARANSGPGATAWHVRGTGCEECGCGDAACVAARILKGAGGLHLSEPTQTAAVAMVSGRRRSIESDRVAPPGCRLRFRPGDPARTAQRVPPGQGLRAPVESHAPGRLPALAERPREKTQNRTAERHQRQVPARLAGPARRAHPQEAPEREGVHGRPDAATQAKTRAFLVVERASVRLEPLEAQRLFDAFVEEAFEMFIGVRFSRPQRPARPRNPDLPVGTAPRNAECPSRSSSTLVERVAARPCQMVINQQEAVLVSTGSAQASRFKRGEGQGRTILGQGDAVSAWSRRARPFWGARGRLPVRRGTLRRSEVSV